MERKYNTLVDTLNALKQEGYTLDFNVKKECLVCANSNDQLSPEDFAIDRVFRFEGASNPDDQAILYAISSEKFNVKGVLVNGYGISADNDTDAIIGKLKTRPE